MKKKSLLIDGDLMMDFLKNGTNYLRDRVKINTSEFFSSYGVRECYESLLERRLINDDELLRKIVSGL